MSYPQSISHRQSWVAAIALTASLALAGCGGTSVATPASAEPPVTLSATAGSDLKNVSLSALAVQRLGILTSAVRKAASAKAGVTLDMPYSALVYDDKGLTWAYVATAPRTYVRKAVTVDYIDGARAFLKDGPAVGAQVVSTGSQELLGAEFEISGE